MADILSQQQLYDLFIQEVQNQDPLVTDTSEGSNTDVIGGAFSVLAAQLSRLIAKEYAKTYFSSAHGPEVTGGADDLETLAVDHFGSQFARPEDTKSEGQVTFSRATADYGEVTVPSGTQLSTNANASGEKQIFITVEDADFGEADTEVTVFAEAQTAGAAGNVASGKVVNIDSALLDTSITVSNDSAFAGGADEENDTEYRETIRNLLASLKGSSLEALEARAKAIPGVGFATAVESLMTVIEYDIGGEAIASGATYFTIPVAYIYVSDDEGNYTDALVEDVQTEIDLYRAAGVRVTVRGSQAVSMDWAATITLNPSGPNFATLSSDASMIVETMENYIKNIDTGTGFDRSTADAALLAIWGPSGTNDLTDFATSTPVGDITVTETQKLIPGTVEVV